METIINFIQGPIVFIIVLSILIVVHEWGHFYTAKKVGINVLEFALGFGKTLYEKTWHGTKYMVKLFPLGGYVRMAGDERDKCKGTPDEFYSQPIRNRALVVFNGPLINFVLAYFCFMLVFLVGYPGITTTVSKIEANSPAAISGMQAGDKILAIDQEKIYGWMHLKEVLEGESADPITVSVERGDEILNFSVIPKVKMQNDILGKEISFRDIGVDNVSTKLGFIADDLPAAAVGLKPGDKIIAIDNQEVLLWEELTEIVENSGGKELKLTILRDDQQFDVMIQPEYVEETDAYRIGVAPGLDIQLFKAGFLESFKKGWDELIRITVLTYRSLYRIVTGQIAAKSAMTGPVGIYLIITGAAEQGISHLLFIVAVISASLAIFNLLPVFPLDGGHLFLMAIEKIQGKQVSPKFEEWFGKIGFSMVILLALFVFYSDFERIGLFDFIKNLIP